MIKFNSNNIITGYIKNLVSTFNLPHYILPNDITGYLENNYYLVNNKIYYYNKAKKLNDVNYSWNKKQLNFTKTFNKAGFVYSSELHEWLGNYLRFVRDYKNIDLMRMYNCFSNNIINGFTFNKGGIDAKEDNNYVIYSLPVKLNQTYTIALSSILGVELRCGFADDYLHSTSLNALLNNTYEKINYCSFNKPFIYDKLKTIFDYLSQAEIDDEAKVLNYQNLYANEDKLRLFIKLPVENNSSIVVLEGIFDYYNDKIFVSDTSEKVENALVLHPTVTIDYDNLDNLQNNLPCKCQLLEINSNVSYPFADRLIEYLVGNVIDSSEKIKENVELVQDKLISSELIKSSDNDGIWKNKYRALLYQASTQNPNLLDKFDMLGYVDKDVEKYLIEAKADIKIIDSGEISGGNS